ncbi:hypothetical protein DVH24_018156 [Malus domestica]|uniref:Glycine-rich protein n=1 Tax=Malus domestica TaxID=3750 RepID=A0A498KI71_MALDO|nr:hypothetical protein DVH24_018156 [Malus domestica]
MIEIILLLLAVIAATLNVIDEEVEGNRGSDSGAPNGMNSGSDSGRSTSASDFEGRVGGRDGIRRRRRGDMRPWAWRVGGLGSVNNFMQRRLLAGVGFWVLG